MKKTRKKGPPLFSGVPRVLTVEERQAALLARIKNTASPKTLPSSGMRDLVGALKALYEVKGPAR